MTHHYLGDHVCRDRSSMPAVRPASRNCFFFFFPFFFSIADIFGRLFDADWCLRYDGCNRSDPPPGFPAPAGPGQSNAAAALYATVAFGDAGGDATIPEPTFEHAGAEYTVDDTTTR